MRRVGVLGVVVAMLVLCVGSFVLAARPVAQAHGEFWTDLHIAGQWFDMQFAFNVQDRGAEGDHGTLSMRIFDHWTAGLVAVGVSTAIDDVFLEDGWIVFYAVLRFPRFDDTYFLPLNLPLYEFRAFDGGDDDLFKMLAVPLPIYKGNIVIR
ncbi:hypothetical protein IH601_09645 [Candidatus Bipolaricaulota bacterium]|nr:hypothetical protein [Candidatus Bipolaricaulota bacterium]TFH07232.1 MAG: hypothetical protein E4H08_09835 [Candidatus Atribacteria bacterium]